MFATYFINLFVAHFYFDILWQSEWQALNKTSNGTALGSHCFLYASGLTAWMGLLGGVQGIMALGFIFSVAFISHLILDSYKIYPWWRKYMVDSDPETTPKWLYIWMDQTFHLLVLYLVAMILS